MVAETYRYDTFGRPATTSSLGNRLLFTGREYDAETGLYYYRARYHDPRLGRFLSRDPLSYGPGEHLYRYVGNTPTMWRDPWGWFTFGLGGFEPGTIGGDPGLLWEPGSMGPIVSGFTLPKPVQIGLILGGIILGPLVGPIPGKAGTGGPIAPKPKPPIELPSPAPQQGPGKKGDSEENGSDEEDGKNESKSGSKSCK